MRHELVDTRRREIVALTSCLIFNRDTLCEIYKHLAPTKRQMSDRILAQLWSAPNELDNVCATFAGNTFKVDKVSHASISNF